MSEDEKKKPFNPSAEKHKERLEDPLHAQKLLERFAASDVPAKVTPVGWQPKNGELLRDASLAMAAVGFARAIAEDLRGADLKMLNARARIGEARKLLAGPLAGSIAGDLRAAIEGELAVTERMLDEVGPMRVDADAIAKATEAVKAH